MKIHRRDGRTLKELKEKLVSPSPESKSKTAQSCKKEPFKDTGNSSIHTTHREALTQEKSTGISGETVRTWHFGRGIATPPPPLCAAAVLPEAAGQSTSTKNSAAWPEAADWSKNPRPGGTVKNRDLSTKHQGKAKLSTSLRL